MFETRTHLFAFLLFSVIPVSIVAGPAVSLIIILLINLLFIFSIIKNKEINLCYSQTVKLLFFIYIYLIFNSLISLDLYMGASRNFGFLRFIIFFIAMNYFFYKYKNFNNFLYAWIVILILFVVDVYIEAILGKNILGYSSKLSERVVSFFKDEQIAGSFINGFIFLLVGFLHNFTKSKSKNYKIAVILFSVFFLIAIILTGERSNSIKAMLGFLVFYFFYDEISPKKKLFSIIGLIGILFIMYNSSNFLKLRYEGQLFNLISSKEKIINFYNKNIYFDIQRTSIIVFKSYPLFGVGNKNFRVETCDEQKNVKYNYICQTHPHQIYFEFLAEHGIIGTVFLLGILFFLVFRILRTIIFSKNYLQLGCFIYILLVFTPILPSGAFFSQFNANLFWINFSILYALSKNTNIFFNKQKI